MNVSRWDANASTSNLSGHITSYAISGNQSTWQNQLHGPHFYVGERSSPEEIPPVYVFATFTNAVYKFENFSLPTGKGAEATPIQATQKLVAHALAPSTGFIVEGDEDDGKDFKGLLIAEGQPFLFSNMIPEEIYKGGVEFINEGHTKNCSTVFPTAPVDRLLGHVTNTVDCNKKLGVCFYTVWKFYDDQKPFSYADDCLWYCIMEEGSLSTAPKCRKTAIVVDEKGEKICHKDGVGAVHGMTVGNTDDGDSTKFDILLVFTGKLQMSNGESSMRKVKVQVTGDGESRDLTVLQSKPYAEDLFKHYARGGVDVGGDHAWVDSTGKFVWISCFRQGGVGVHMVSYDTGELIYSLTGLDKYVPNQYSYTSGIHGVGTVGQKGSYLAVATSSCHDVKECIPVVPWDWPIPKSMWSQGSFFVIDLSSLTEDSPPRIVTPEVTLV